MNRYSATSLPEKTCRCSECEGLIVLWKTKRERTSEGKLVRERPDGFAATESDILMTYFNSLLTINVVQ